MAAACPGINDLMNKFLSLLVWPPCRQKEIGYVKGLRDIPESQRDAGVGS